MHPKRPSIQVTLTLQVASSPGGWSFRESEDGMGKIPIQVEVEIMAKFEKMGMKWMNFIVEKPRTESSL